MDHRGDDLWLTLTDIVPEGEAHVRQTVYDEIETRLPRDPEARIDIQLSELLPGATAAWHVHNGLVYFLVTRGAVSLHYEGRTEHYAAGDVYTEPVGVVHRAYNPHPTLPVSFVGFWITSADRPHLVPVGEPEWRPVEEPHPRLA